MLRLAQAASSENFGKYGTPPNQRRTGVTPDRPEGNRDGELNVIPFYGGWSAVFRPKDESKAEKIAWLAEGAVDNGSFIGYGQGSLKSDGGIYHREGVFDYLYGMLKPDTRKIDRLCNCDCSSLTGGCVYNAGVYEPALRTMWTGTEPQILMGTGEFVKLTDPLLLELGAGLKRGDILWMPGHTAVAIDTDDHEDTYPVIIRGCAYTRIRRGPGIDYGTITVIPNGKTLDALGKAEDDDGDPWYRVSYDGQTGYTSALYAVPLPTGNCIGDVWLRTGPGTSNHPIIVIPKGTPECYLTGATEQVLFTTWYECIYAGHRGWASGKYIKP